MKTYGPRAREPQAVNLFSLCLHFIFKISSCRQPTQHATSEDASPSIMESFTCQAPSYGTVNRGVCTPRPHLFRAHYISNYIDLTNRLILGYISRAMVARLAIWVNHNPNPQSTTPANVGFSVQVMTDVQVKLEVLYPVLVVAVVSSSSCCSSAIESM